MSQIEMMWVQRCEACGCEHRHMETLSVGPAGDSQAAVEAFHARCRAWYQVHLDLALAAEPVECLSR